MFIPKDVLPKEQVLDDISSSINEIGIFDADTNRSVDDLTGVKEFFISMNHQMV